ncbi:hypothetical protein AAG906_031136 [Vitis piasezkii]
MEMEDVLNVYAKAKSDQLLKKRYRPTLETLKYSSSNWYLGSIVYLFPYHVQSSSLLPSLEKCNQKNQKFIIFILQGEMDDMAMDVNFSEIYPLRRLSPEAEGSFTDARGDIIISHDNFAISSSSVAFELNSKVQTSCPGEYWLNRKDYDVKSAMPLIIEGVELDLRMRGFEFFNFVSSYPFDSPRPVYLKATGRIKFQGNVEKRIYKVQITDKENTHGLVGDISISGLKLNQLMLAPQLAGTLNISHECIQFNATGKPDESLSVKVVGLLQPNRQLKTNVCYRPLHYANLEVRHLPLDELEVASLRGTIQRFYLCPPKFSGVGEALDVAARWSGMLNSRYELQGEYVLPGTRDWNPSGKQRGGLLERAMAGHLGSVISSMGRWRMRLEVPRAEVAEMLPLARLLSRSTDPAVRSRSKDLFIQSLQSVGLYTGIILEDVCLPGLAELKGRWHGSLDARVLSCRWSLESLASAGNLIPMPSFTLYSDFNKRDWEGEPTKLSVFKQLVNTAMMMVYTLRKSLSKMIMPQSMLMGPWGHLHMEGDLRGSIAKPECNVRSVPVAFVQNNMLEEDIETWIPGWVKERGRGPADDVSEKKISRDRNEEGWDTQLAESLKALSPYADWLHGNADIMLQVRGTVEQPNLPLRISEASLGDKIDLKCEVDTQMQITGSILQPNISGNIKLSHGEAYLPPDKGTGAAPFNRLASVHPSGGYNPGTASRYLSWFPSSEPAPQAPNPSTLRYFYKICSTFATEIIFIFPGKQTDVEKEMEQVNRKRLTFESGEVNLVATQVRLKKEHLNIAKFEPDNGLDPTLDLALVGSEWQFRIQSRASNWQDNLVVTSTRAAARVFESQLAESILEGDGKLSFKKLATATLETLMPRIEGKGEFGQARWRIVYAPQIFSLLSVDPAVDPLKSLASNISFGTEVEIKLETPSVLLQSWSVSSQRLLFEYSSTSQN